MEPNALNLAVGVELSDGGDDVLVDGYGVAQRRENFGGDIGGSRLDVSGEVLVVVVVVVVLVAQRPAVGG